MKKPFIILITIGALILLGFLGFLIFKKVQVKTFIDNAKKAEQHNDFDTARVYYNKAKKLDKDNLDVKYGLVDLEKKLVKNDCEIIDTLYSTMAYGIFDYQVINSKDFCKPEVGDYGLYDFCSSCGATYLKYVDSNMGDITLSNIMNKLVSNDKNGEPLSIREIRVALYEFKTNRVSFCVYIPNSFNPNTNTIIYSGEKYQPDFDFEKAKEQVFTHVTFFDLEFPQTGDVLIATEYETSRTKTAMNSSKEFTVMSYNPPEFNTKAYPALLEGCVLKDENGIYYVVRGRINGWRGSAQDISINELMEISEEDALSNLDWSNSKLEFDSVYPQN